MKKVFLFSFLMFLAISSYSQSKQITGSWIWRDSSNAIQFFINKDESIEKRTALATEYIWGKTPKTGTYTFSKDHILIIKWSDKTTENAKVKFVSDLIAEIQFTNPQIKSKQTYTFNKIVDEEIIPDK